MKKLFISSVALIVAVVFVITTQSAQGSIEIGHGYQSRTVSSSNASSTQAYVIRGGGPAILGSIVIGSSSPALSTNVIRVYNSSSATSSASLIATIRGGVSEQTLTYDISLTQGLTLDVPAAFNGNYTITYR